MIVRIIKAYDSASHNINRIGHEHDFEDEEFAQMLIDEGYGEEVKRKKPAKKKAETAEDNPHKRGAENASNDPR